MSTETATVQTLTASVNVLMVSTRQVTLSVYRQLDSVPPQRIHPWGRVNVGRGNDGEGPISIVGVDDSGSLVQSSVDAGSSPQPEPLLDAYLSTAVREWTNRQQHWQEQRYRGWVRYHGATDDYVSSTIKEMLDAQHAYVPISAEYAEAERARFWASYETWAACEPAAPDAEAEATVRAAHAGNWAAWRLREDWRALPLIVLAGLR